MSAPVAAPDDFDDVPSGAPEGAFQLLDDLAVPANRPVEPLEVAVDDEDQIVESLSRGQRDRSERFRLIGFSISHENPDVRSRGFLQTPVLQVSVKASLVDAADRRQTHRNGGILPEVGLEPGMWIGRQPAPGDLRNPFDIDIIDGNLHVIGYRGHRVTVFAPDGTPVDVINHNQGNRPRAMYRAPDGRRVVITTPFERGTELQGYRARVDVVDGVSGSFSNMF